MHYGYTGDDTGEKGGEGARQVTVTWDVTVTFDWGCIGGLW